MVKETIKNKNDAINFAQDILIDKNNYIILEAETTGLGDNDVIIQIGVLDLDGHVLLDTFIKPTKRKRISDEATVIHGITMKMLRDAPTFKEIYPKFFEVVKGKNLLIYNAEYDCRLLTQTIIQDEFIMNDFNALCIMKVYSAYVGEWSDYHDRFKFQKLPGGDHTAIGDCKATLELIKKISVTEKNPSPKKKWWQF
jgi:DNA polymerase-3 subunit epsilon